MKKNLKMVFYPLVMAIMVFFIIFSFLSFKILVPTGSMIPTIKPDEELRVIRTKNVERGDIVVFTSDEEGKLLVKRLIAMGGDSVKILEGKLYVNNKLIEEPYVINQDYSDYPIGDIPEGYYLFLGDNRLNSRDARFWSSPFIPKDKVLGKVSVRTYPYTRMGVVK